MNIYANNVYEVLRATGKRDKRRLCLMSFLEDETMISCARGVLLVYKLLVHVALSWTLHLVKRRLSSPSKSSSICDNIFPTAKAICRRWFIRFQHSKLVSTPAWILVTLNSLWRKIVIAAFSTEMKIISPYHNTFEKMNNEVSRYVVFMSMLQLLFSILRCCLVLLLSLNLLLWHENNKNIKINID